MLTSNPANRDPPVQDTDSISSLDWTCSASDDLAQLPFAHDDDDGIVCIEELYAKTVWSTRTYEQELELRDLQGQALGSAFEASAKNAAGRRVPPVGDVSTISFKTRSAPVE